MPINKLYLAYMLDFLFVHMNLSLTIQNKFKIELKLGSVKDNIKLKKRNKPASATPFRLVPINLSWHPLPPLVLFFLYSTSHKWCHHNSEVSQFPHRATRACFLALGDTALWSLSVSYVFQLGIVEPISRTPRLRLSVHVSVAWAMHMHIGRVYAACAQPYTRDPLARRDLQTPHEPATQDNQPPSDTRQPNQSIYFFLDS